MSESWQPQLMSKKAVNAKSGHRTQSDNQPGWVGFVGVELFIQGDQVWFSEVSPRPHDTGMVTMISQRYSEFELHAAGPILGLPVDVAYAQRPGPVL